MPLNTFFLYCEKWIPSSLFGGILTSQFDLFINHQWQAATGPIFTSRNPMSEDLLWQGHSASETEVNAAVSAARAAFKEWANRSLETRFGYLEKFRDALKESSSILAETISKETGKPLWNQKQKLIASQKKWVFQLRPIITAVPK